MATSLTASPSLPGASVAFVGPRYQTLAFDDYGGAESFGLWVQHLKAAAIGPEGLFAGVIGDQGQQIVDSSRLRVSCLLTRAAETAIVCGDDATRGAK